MAKQKTILFLCTGNYYRSRFAEVLFVSIAKKMGLPWNASSRGLALERGVNNVGPMAKAAINTLESMGIRDTDRCGRFPVPVTIEELEQADVIIALKHAEHLPILNERFPAFTERVEFWHVDDAPEALDLIESKIMDLMARLLGGGGEAPRQEELRRAPTSEAPRKPMTAKVGRETAGRRGKGVTTVFDVPQDEDGLLELAAKLKQRCGTGGTVKDDFDRPLVRSMRLELGTLRGRQRSVARDHDAVAKPPRPRLFGKHSEAVGVDVANLHA